MAVGSKRLPRRRNARTGELDLEQVCEERIDAVTAEPLVAGKYVEVLSPDKTLKLFYNTSTLIRIAMDKGTFMQPPHFREPMEVAMQRRIEKLEGKTFHFEAHDRFLPATQVGDDDHSAGGLAVHHRHVYFDQIVDEFYLLNPAELYVCSICYEHYVQTRFLPDEEQHGRRIQYLERDGEEDAIAVLDPLDVLSHMAQPAVAVTADEDRDTDSVRSSLSDSPLVHIAFRYAVPWKKHMKLHHEVTGVSAEDYTVRARLCNFYSHFNQWQTQRYEARLETHGDAKPKPALTQQRYWLYSAGYNRLRYNRLVESVEACQGDAHTYECSAFPGEEIAVELNPDAQDDDVDDFICDDSDTDDDHNYPHFSPSSADEQSDEEVPEVTVRRRPSAGKKRPRSAAFQEDDSSSSSSSSCVSSKSSDSSVVVTEDDDDEDEEEDYVSSQIQKQNTLFARGLLTERDRYYQRLSADDRQFLENASRRATHVKSTLYDPKMVTLTAGRSAAPSTTASMDVDDWENIGGTLQSPHTLQLASKSDESAKRVSPAAPPQFRTSAMLLDDE